MGFFDFFRRGQEETVTLHLKDIDSYIQNNISLADSAILSEVISQEIDEFKSFDDKLKKIYLEEKVNLN